MCSNLFTYKKEEEKLFADKKPTTIMLKGARISFFKSKLFYEIMIYMN